MFKPKVRSWLGLVLGLVGVVADPAFGGIIGNEGREVLERVLMFGGTILAATGGQLGRNPDKTDRASDTGTFR